MNSARVVVIDEDPDEALLLLTALGTAKIGTVYIQGTEQDQLPDEPIDGIRVVLLDLKLLPVAEPENYIPHTVNVLKQSVNFESKTTGIVCWTKQTDDIDLLKSELERQEISPVFISVIENKLQICEAQDVTEILKQVDEATSQKSGWRLLQQWEMLAHDAVTGTTESLSVLSEDDAELLRILGAVCRGAATSKVTQDSSLDSLISGLNAILSDETEELSGVLQDGKLSRPLFEAVRQLRNSPLSIEQKAMLNKVLLTTNSTSLQPGAVYIQSSWVGETPFPFALDDSGIRGFLKEVFPDNRNDDVFISAVAETAIPCIIEVTPACDFAQEKCDNARFLGGVLVACPGDEERQRLRSLPASSRMFAKELPFKQSRSERLDGSFKVIMNARRLRVVEFSELEAQKAEFRVRPSVVAELLTWLGSHVSRPGIISV